MLYRPEVVAVEEYRQFAGRPLQLRREPVAQPRPQQQHGESQHQGQPHPAGPRHRVGRRLQRHGRAVRREVGAEDGGRGRQGMLGSQLVVVWQIFI